MHEVLVGEAVRDQAGKGHDRVFVDAELALVAVFDGAGGAELSDAIVAALPGTLANHARRRRAQETFLSRVAADLDALPEGQVRRSTAAIACARPLRSIRRVELAWLCAGDTSIHLLDRTAGTFSRVAHTPSEVVTPRNGVPYTDTSEFLGAHRSAMQLSALVGRVTVPRSHGWCLVCTSDGVHDDDGHGIADEAFEALVREAPADELADRVIGAIPHSYDDASVAVLASVP